MRVFTEGGEGRFEERSCTLEDVESGRDGPFALIIGLVVLIDQTANGGARSVPESRCGAR